MKDFIIITLRSVVTVSVFCSFAVMLFLSSLHGTVDALSIASPLINHCRCTVLFSSFNDNNRRELTGILQEENGDAKKQEEEYMPAGTGGSEFFGGNQEKYEFYDPIAERRAGDEIELKSTSYDRFCDKNAPFDTIEVAIFARTFQKEINSVLYGENKISERFNRISNENDDGERCPRTCYSVYYSPSLAWETPLIQSEKSNEDKNESTTNPISELTLAKRFYEELDLAIVSGKKISDHAIQLSWEISLVWPALWYPRILLSGTSTCILEKPMSKLSQITDERISVIKQVDSVFGTDGGNSFSLAFALGRQIIPRFWDWYHIGMTPSAQMLPRRTVGKKGEVRVFQLPPRLVSAPTIVETGTREERHAEIIPNHAFTCAIKTMGPNRKKYVPTTPVEVTIRRNVDVENDDHRLRIKWSIPLSTHFQAINYDLPLPSNNPEEESDASFPTFEYQWEPIRQVATIKFGGNAQDVEIRHIRQRLYEQVLEGGWRPRLNRNGKPQFFFWQNDQKACFVDDGFGMAVCDWRPKFSNSNEVGIELNVDPL